MEHQSWLIVFVPSIIILGFTVSILPIVLAFRHSRRKLELDHAERMKAIELGGPVPRQGEGEDEPWTMAARLVMALGVVVPLGSLGCAFFASLALGFHQAIWVMAGMVGLGGVLCGGLLAGQTFGANRRSPEFTDLKPYVEEDAYDVVGARG
jgi:hypothetical protein